MYSRPLSSNSATLSMRNTTMAKRDKKKQQTPLIQKIVSTRGDIRKIEENIDDQKINIED